MSDPDPQKCNCFDGSLLCTKTFWGDFFLIKKGNQFKVDSNELKVNWFHVKSFLINRYL